MPSNQNFFHEPKLTIIPKSDKTSLKRHPALTGHVLFHIHMLHHHTAALAFCFILSDNIMWHLFLFEFRMAHYSYQYTHCPTYFSDYFGKIRKKFSLLTIKTLQDINLKI